MLSLRQYSRTYCSVSITTIQKKILNCLQLIENLITTIFIQASTKVLAHQFCFERSFLNFSYIVFCCYNLVGDHFPLDYFSFLLILCCSTLQFLRHARSPRAL